MSLPGTEVQRIVERGSREAQRFAELSAAEFEAAQSAAVDAVERRGTALLQLARHYLPSLDNTSIGARFAEVREEIEALRHRRESRVRELQAIVEAADVERQALEDRVVETTHRLEEKVAGRQDLQQRAARILTEDTAFQQLANASARAEARLERDEARADELEHESDEKLPAFEQSRLFRYLYDRRFGTPEYRSRGLVRRIDRWVAKLIDFVDARASYDFLRSMPELVDVEVTRRRAEFDDTMAKIDQQRADVERQVGLPELIAEGERIGAERDRLVDALDAEHDRASEARQRIAEIEEQRGGFHAEAMQRLRDHLERLNTDDLETHARGTAEPTDDRIVAEIASATREIDGQRVRIETLVEQRRTAAERARELLDVAQRLRRSNFDSMRSRFDGIAAVDLERRLQRIAQGTESPADLWKDLSSRQRFEQPSLPDERPGTPWPPSRRRGRSSRSRAKSGGGEFPWWLAHALGAAVDIGLRAAAGRGITRRGGGLGGGMFGGGGGSSGGGGGGFTRGSGF